jgi:hypothetical protein
VSNVAQAAIPLWNRMAARRKRRAQWISFLHEKNLKLLRRHLAESDQRRNPQRYNMLLRLLAEEEAKEKKPLSQVGSFPNAWNGPPRNVRFAKPPARPPQSSSGARGRARGHCGMLRLSAYGIDQPQGNEQAPEPLGLYGQAFSCTRCVRPHFANRCICAGSF